MNFRSTGRDGPPLTTSALRVRRMSIAASPQVMPHLDRPLFCTTVPAVADGAADAALGPSSSSTVTGFGIYEAYKNGVDFVVDDGVRQDVSTVIDLTDVNNAVLVRLGSGSVALFEEHLSTAAADAT